LGGPLSFKLMSVFVYLSYYDDEFRHNIVKVVFRSTRLSNRGSTATFEYVVTKFMIKNRTETLKTDANLLNRAEMRLHAPFQIGKRA